MSDIYLTNSLTRKKEKFEPIKPDEVGMYTCGPTVYDYATIGNFRTYTTSDLVHRMLKFNGYEVKFIMNITDVGHLSGDNLGDADTGEDRMQKAAKKENKTAWDIAQFYTDAFLSDFEKLNLLKPFKFTKATDYIQEQINLVKILEEKGFTYKINDGIYFDTQKYEERTGQKYGQLSDLDKIKEGARVEPNPEKKNPRDFALWKFSPKEEKRQMEWESPWGIGFPGWHVECSAMSMKYLGETFDIHAGGEDIKQTHHVNEIAQSEASTGKKFVNYWIHGAFLKVDGGRMGKSLGNAYTISDIEKKGYDPLAIRYLYLGSHYRDSLNFTWESLSAAQNGLNNLRSLVAAAKHQNDRTVLSPEKEEKIKDLGERFEKAINDDLNTSSALAILWEALKSNIPSEDKYDLAISFDEVLGLDLAKIPNDNFQVPNEVKELLKERRKAREEKNWEKSDELRRQINEIGYDVLDTGEGTHLKKI